MGGVDGCTAKRRETVARDRIRRCGCQEAVEVSGTSSRFVGKEENRVFEYTVTVSLFCFSLSPGALPDLMM